MKTLFIGDIVGRKARNFAIEKIKEFKNPKFAIAPGQSIVFYAGNTCIGGGYIETRSNKNIS